jgi:hypothetical protein
LEVGQGDGVIASHPEQKPERKIHRTARNNATNRRFIHMIAITITPEAYEVILLGTAEAPSPSGQDGLIRVWLDCKFVDRLGQVRSPGESYSDVILRLAEEG